MTEDAISPDEDELAMGEELACDLIAHLKRMNAVSTSFEILDGDTVWKVTVEAKAVGKVNLQPVFVVLWILS
jgi:hypothetical protein